MSDINEKLSIAGIRSNIVYAKALQRKYSVMLREQYEIEAKIINDILKLGKSK